MRRTYTPPRTTPCDHCAQPVIWTIVARSGKRMPIDPEPVPNGGIVIDAEKYAIGVTPVATVLTGETRHFMDTHGNYRKRYQHHEVSCTHRMEATS